MSDSTYYSSSELRSLTERGVTLHAPEQTFIRRDVDLNQLASGAELFPGTRLEGAGTRLFPGAQIGRRGPAHLEDSLVGSGATVGSLGPVTLVRTTVGPASILGSGVAEDAVFLGKETMENDFTTGAGFRVRKGSLYEEDASTAQHTDTKMTILFPWVTLGSNLNFCEVLVSGGTGPELGAFSEVGSGTIHFNFTARGDKATASLLGEVTRGLLLNQPRLFIGGNCSLIGPLSADFGTIIGAGSRITGSLASGVHVAVPRNAQRDALPPTGVHKAEWIFRSQLRFIEQMLLLEWWYRHVRLRLFPASEEQRIVYQRGQAVVARNLQERVARLEDWVQQTREEAPLSLEGIGKEWRAQLAQQQEDSAQLEVPAEGEAELMASEGRSAASSYTAFVQNPQVRPHLQKLIARWTEVNERARSRCCP